MTQFPNARWLAQFRCRLLAWFGKNARDLPWRRTRDPYAVWVSEIMLQQTQVETVKQYFERFLKALPDVHALAAAEEQRVLRLWEGLGYYRRARQMHQAAKVIAAEHAGEFPRTAEELRALPGIGRYTAGAIASIAFDEPAPILEANTIRLLCRLLAFREDPAKSAGQQLLWSFAEELLPKKQAGRFNQALMELGSLICTPKSPACASCPVMSLCPTLARGLQEEIPRAKEKKKYEDVHEAAVVIRRRGRVLLRRCAEGERWEGLWDFPRVAVTAANGHLPASEIGEKIARQIGRPIQLGSLLATLKHGVTRFRITLSCYEATSDVRSQAKHATSKTRWVSAGELSTLPLSTTGRKIARLL
jgi:A/G-specific adenine glycosylase